MFKGISNEELQKALKILFPVYLNSYREHVTEVYKEEYEEAGNNIFNFMQPVKCIVLMHGNNSYLLFYKNEKDELLFKDCTSIELSDFDVLSERLSKFKKKFIQDTLQLDLDFISSLKLSDFVKYGALGLRSPDLNSISKSSGIHGADEDYKTYELNKALEQIIIPSSKTEIVDTASVLQKVNDPSFQYEFEESIKAYNAGLYLAAAATGGIALENILRVLIIKNFDKKRLPDKTYIDRSVRVLDEKKILPGRLRADILKSIGVRNANAHTNEDPVRKDTVEALYRIIFDVSILLW